MFGLSFEGNIANLFLFGLLMGMRHASEADHLAAVAALINQKQPLSYTIKQGTAWGIGHALTLFLFGSIVLFMDTVIPEYLASRLEMSVGFILTILGADVLRRVIQNKVYFHDHTKTFPVNALLVGLMHGMAGSAVVILLTIESGVSVLDGILFILLFGIGSMLGMAILSVAITIPIRYFARQLSWANNIIQVLIGLLTLSLGLIIIVQNSKTVFG